MTVFYRRTDADGTTAGVHMMGGDFDQECAISLALIACADPSFLRRDGDTIVITTDEGRATYRVTGEDALQDVGREPSGVVTATLVSVERAGVNA